MTPREITSDIRWILQDNGLDTSPDFKVTTKRIGENTVTTVRGVSAQVAQEALSEYGSNSHAEFATRDFDGSLTITQPAKR
jgi:hypothetical protein